MNGYLNNLTLRTLNAGNRVEPRLPALFEPRVFESAPTPAVERSGPLEEDVTTVSEAAAPRVKTAEPSSDDAAPDGPSVTKRETETSPVTPKTSAVKPDEGLEEPVSHEVEREEPAADLTVQATLQPRTETVEIATSRTIEDVETPMILEEVDERLTPSLELDDSLMLKPVSRRETQKQAVTTHHSPRKNPATQPAVVIPTQSPERDQFQTQLTFQQTTPTNNPEATLAPIEVTQNEEISQIEQRVTNKPEPEFESTQPSPYRRVNPTPATWRDTRQQWRRRQSPAPVESEPSINVTIGRIEVRAVPADTRKTTAPRRSESPVMPLEDYLRKQRRGGER